MTLDEIRTYFVTARNFVKLGNSANIAMIVASIDAISQHIKEVYKTASALDKAKCKLQYESFDSIINIVKINGLHDNRVLAFFGLAPSTATAPSFSDIMSGNAPEKKQDNPKTEESNGNDNISLDKPINLEPNISQILTEKINPTTPIAPIKGAEKNIVEVDKPLFTPDSLDNFIGQEHIKRPLRKEIAIAKAEGRKHLDNILLFGNPGLGKTTLMELIAKELGVRFELLDCSQFRNSQQSLKALQNFFLRIARNNEPVVIALDEIHMLNNELQSSLLTLLNSRVYVSPLDVNGQCKSIPIDEFTFIAATTDDDKVLDTIKNRCLRLKFQMVDYTFDELKLIYKNKVAAKGLTITEGAIDMCIPRSRGAIRYVNAIVEGLNSALYNDDGIRMSTHIDIQVVYKYFDEKGIDPLGLEKKDLEILRTIEESPNGVISADVLAARVGLDTKKYISEYEKYLIKIGFIDVTGRGRSLTEKALRYLSKNSKCEEQENTDYSGANVDDGNKEDVPKDIIDDFFGGGDV
ncbi:MAG: AAA family ATPase [Clostridia bacterium]|nr:AAA family ATPase [Clostridia bacterium]